jgi:hypothetical protein
LIQVAIVAFQLNLNPTRQQSMPVSNFPLHTAAPRENLQRFERGAHGAAMIDPRAERAWRALPLRLCVSHDE